MKAFVISLRRALDRRKYIISHLNGLGLEYEIIDAVDGLQISEEDIPRLANAERVSKTWWFGTGTIGCALSHKNAYEAIIAAGLPYALVVEDDIILPKNIKDILDELAGHISKNEVVLLYFTSNKTCTLSRVQMEKTPYGDLLFPAENHYPGSTAAYIITKEAAERIIRVNTPVRETSDSWGYFVNDGGVESVRLLFPKVVAAKFFKSSIEDYTSGNAIVKIISTLVDKYKIPVLYQLFSYRRIKSASKIEKNFIITNDIPYLLRNKD